MLTTLYSMWLSFPLTYRVKPDLVLCNGPGTCVPICISALLLGILGIKKVIIVYVESICRVEHLSLSGKILFHLSDYFIVQWPTLKEKYPKSVYLGRIVWPTTTYFFRILLATVFTVNGEQKKLHVFYKKAFENPENYWWSRVKKCVSNPVRKLRFLL